MAFTYANLTERYGALVRLGVPIVVGQIGNVVLGFTDTIMVGHHSMEELAAASFVNTMFLLVVIFATGFSYGLTPVVGSLFGQGDSGAIGRAVKNSLAANLALSAVLVAVCSAFCLNIHRFGQPEELLPLMRPYLWVNIASLPFLCCFNTFKQFFDGVTDTRTPMYVIIGGNLLNIFGNWVLIYGELGAPSWDSSGLECQRRCRASSWPLPACWCSSGTGVTAVSAPVSPRAASTVQPSVGLQGSDCPSPCSWAWRPRRSRCRQSSWDGSAPPPWPPIR